MQIENNSLSVLSKLLAMENITVLHVNQNTASFDIISRELRMPIMLDLSAVEEVLLVLHEVGHALFTGTDYIDYIKKEQDTKRGFGQYMNVIEDARIERLMKERYPGSRKDFFAGYTSFQSRDFFKISGVDVNSLCLIDRINLFFKIGVKSGVKFTKEEREFVLATEKAETLSQVYDVALAVYMFSVMQQEQKKNTLSLQGFGDDDVSSEEGDGDEYEFDYMDGSDFDDESEEGESGSGEDSDEDGEGSEEGEGESGSDEDSDEDDFAGELPYDSYGLNGSDSPEPKSAAPESITQQNFDKQVSAHVKNDKFARLYVLPENQITPLVVGYKDVIRDFKLIGETASEWISAESELYADFKKKSDRAVSHMVKEFEMRKAAQRASRTRVDKSGALSANSLFKYKISEDLFRKNEVVFDDTNHAFLMLLDWSGSMRDNLMDSVGQIISLVSFCRKAKIKFQVFAFGDNLQKMGRKSVLAERKSYPTGNFALFGGNLNLFNFFDSRMSQAEFDFVSKMLYTRACFFESKEVAMGYSLSSTPLTPAYCWLNSYIDEFKKLTGAEKISVITCTDGAGNSDVVVAPKEMGNRWQYRNFLRCKKTNASYPMNGRNSDSLILSLIKNANPDVRFIGFFISDFSTRSLRNFTRAVEVNGSTEFIIQEAKKSMREHGYFAVPVKTHHALYVIPATKVADDSMQSVTSELNARQLSKKLSDSFGAIGKSRVVLTKFIEQIS